MSVSGQNALGLSSYYNITNINQTRRLLRLRNLLCNVALQIQLEASQGKRSRVAFITVTYRTPDDYQPGHINNLIACYRIWLKRHNVKSWTGLWVAEMQSRGVIHYHILLWLPYGITPPKPDKQGWWKYGMSRVEWVRYDVVRYLSKYLSKGSNGIAYPKGARIYGFLNLSKEAILIRRHYMLPYWLRKSLGNDSFAANRTGVLGYWYSEDTGKSYRSPYRCSFTDNVLLVSHQDKYDVLDYDIRQLLADDIYWPIWLELVKAQDYRVWGAIVSHTRSSK